MHKHGLLFLCTLPIILIVLSGCQSSTKIDGAKSEAKRESTTQRLSVKTAEPAKSVPARVRIRVVAPKQDEKCRDK